jgi:AmmeMemoRadiSam system protein B/AmmeMemoRadiSam system protein A
MGRFHAGVLGVLLIATSCGAATEVRPPAVAGAFYERMPFALDRQINDLLRAAGKPALSGQLVAAGAPPPGFVCAGRGAPHVYALVVSGRYERVAILAPSHRAYVEGVSLPDAALTAYATPLGHVPIDRAVCDALREKAGFVTVAGADAREHALEVHLPFLQKTAGAFKLVPLICGRANAAQIEAVAGALAPYLGSNTLLIASSDFTHYGPNYDFVPFSEKVPEQLDGWLDRAAGRIAALDVEGFERHCRETRDTICGEIPVRILMAALKGSGGPVSGRVLATATSGELTGNHDNSVSYAAIGFFATKPGVPGGGANLKEGRTVKEHRSGEWTPGLTDEEKATLFAIARDTLKWCVEGGKGRFAFDGYTLTPVMKTNTATFVTLKIHGQLRGCIGSLAPVEPLYMSVHDNAINAALRDPRFPPVRPDELRRIEVDVSILSPIRDIPSVGAFKIGQHGIILEKGRYRAVYLPEVATEQGWTVDETLSSLSMKAGLPPDAWKEGASFKVFESVVLSE